MVPATAVGGLLACGESWAGKEGCCAAIRERAVLPAVPNDMREISRLRLTIACHFLARPCCHLVTL